MEGAAVTDGPDRWQRWLLDVRFGGDAAARQQDLAEFLYPVRDEVLDRAGLRPGDTVLDVGTGDGLIAFGALDRLGPSGQVIFSDISQGLLDPTWPATSPRSGSPPTKPCAAPGPPARGRPRPPKPAPASTTGSRRQLLPPCPPAKPAPSGQVPTPSAHRYSHQSL
jgi:hypothetical protein